MGRLRELIEKYNRQRGEAGDLLDKYHAHLDEGGDQTRADELRQQYERAFEAASETKKRVDELRRLADLGDIDIAREDTSFGADSRDRTGRPNAGRQSIVRDLSPPSLEVMHRRQDILEDMMVGYQPRESELFEACRVAPVERMFPRILLHRRRPGDAGLTREHLDAWGEYEKRAREVIQQRAPVRAPTYGLTAGQGGDFIPTFLYPMIYSAIQFIGPLAGDRLVTVLTAPGDSQGGKVTMDVPTAVHLAPASPTAASEPITADRQNTGIESLSTENYTKLVNVPSQILLGSWVNFESWVMRSVVEAFGLGFNRDRTVGDGSSKISGAFHGLTASVTQGANGAITEKELSDLVAALGTGYHNRMNTRLMFTKATELYLARQRSSSGAGERLYPYMQGRLGAAGGTGAQLSLPGGIMYEINDDLGQLGANGRTTVGIGDFSQYAVLYGGGMRAALNHVVRSDQWEMGWYWQADGGRIIDGAFKVMASS